MLNTFYNAAKDNYSGDKISLEEALKLTGWDLNTSMGVPLIDCCQLSKENIEF